MLPVKWWLKPDFVQSRFGLHILTKEPSTFHRDEDDSDAEGDDVTHDVTKV